MAFIVKPDKQSISKNKFDNHKEAQIIFIDASKKEEERIEALEYLLETQSIAYILKIANQLFSFNLVENHIYIDFIFTGFSNKEKNEDDFKELFNTLGSKNVYLRNMAIKYLQESDEGAIEFIERLLKNPDKDLRIFAINILGDVRYEKSVDILRYFVASEDNINAVMTAVDYLGEIGSLEDIPLLETLKQTHKENPYVIFGVDTAINRIKG